MNARKKRSLNEYYINFESNFVLNGSLQHRELFNEK